MLFLLFLIFPIAAQVLLFFLFICNQACSVSSNDESSEKDWAQMKVKSKMCFAVIIYGLCNLSITVEAFFKYAVFFFFFFDIVHYSMLLFRPSSLQTFSPPVCEATSPGTSQASSTLQSMYFSFICQFISHRYVNVFLIDMSMCFSTISQLI